MTREVITKKTDWFGRRDYNKTYLNNESMLTTFFFIIFLLPLSVYSQTTSVSKGERLNKISLSKSLSDIKNEISSMKKDKENGEKYQALFDKFQDKIVKERSSHQTFVENTFSNFISYIEIVIGASGIIFIVLTLYFGNNAKKHIEAKMNEKLSEAETDVQKEVTKFKGKLEGLNAELDTERSYLSQNITYIQTQNSSDNLKAETELLRNAGFSIKKVSKAHPRYYGLDDLKDTDVLLISASQDDDLVEVFEAVNNHINLSAKRIPIVVYCKGRVEKFNDLLDQHQWVIAANMPLTLVNSIFTASKIKSLT